MAKLHLTCLLLISFFSCYSTITVPVEFENPCYGNDTIVDRDACLNEVANILAQLQANAFLAVTLRNVCSEATHQCFVATNNMEIDCSFDSTSGRIDCQCPQNNVRWENDLDLAIYVPGKSCSDIDECDRKTDTCDNRASCTNSDGLFSCACPSGFIGDGMTCSLSRDECSVPVAPVCASEATCTPTTVQVNDNTGCYILADFTTSTASSTSSTISDCIANCPSASALLTIGDDCYCVSGSAAQQNSALCSETCTSDSSLTCGDSAGMYGNIYQLVTTSGHDCTCNVGYEGDGFICTNVNECDSANVCPSGNDCTDTVGSYTCTCTTASHTKLPTGECVAPAATIDCDAIDESAYNKKEFWNSDCSVVYLTACDNDGSDLSSDGERLEVTVGPHASCTPGLTSTFSKSDFIKDDFLDGSASNLLGITVECTQSNMVVMFDRYVINEAGFTLSDMGIGNIPNGGAANYASECRGRRYYETGAQYRFETSTETTQCDTVTTVMGGGQMIKYTNSIMGQVGSDSSLISRERIVDIEFSCIYDTTTETSSGGTTFFVYDLSKRRKRQADSQTLGENVVVASLWSDAAFTTLHSGNQVMKPNDMIFSQLALQKSSNENQYVIQVMRCWTSPPSGDEEHILISNGCGAISERTSFPNNVVIYENGISERVRIGFRLKSFQVEKVENIHIYCLVHKCNKLKTVNCEKTCEDKNQPSDSNSFQVLANMEVVASGPIVFSDVCGGKLKGGCEQLCSMGTDGQPECSCVPGFGIDPDDPSSCKVIPVEKPTTPEKQTAPWYSYVVPILIVILIFAIVAVVVLKKNRDLATRDKYHLPDLADADADM